MISDISATYLCIWSVQNIIRS